MTYIARLPVILALLTGCDLEAPIEADPGVDAGAETIGAAGAGELVVVTYNIRHAADASLSKLASIIRAEAPDVVLLQEVDRHAERSGGVDQASRLRSLAGLPHSRFVRAIDLRGGGQYGLAFLSRYPISDVRRIALPSRGERRILAIATLTLPNGRTVQVANTHFGLRADERADQARTVAGLLSGDRRTILGGDLNAPPGERAVHDTLGVGLDDAWTLLRWSRGATTPAYLPLRRFDYLYLSGDLPQPRSIRVVGSWAARFASDHRPVVATVRLP